MQGLFFISALVMCYIFSVVSALNCYHCATVDATIAIGRTICGDEDQMKSSDCSMWTTPIPKLVQTKVGILPLQIAAVFGYNDTSLISVKEDDKVIFKCVKIKGEFEEQAVTGEFRVHSCIAEKIEINGEAPVELWTWCNSNSKICDLCGEDNCNSASGITSSLILSTVLVVMAMLRFY